MRITVRLACVVEALGMSAHARRAVPHAGSGAPQEKRPPTLRIKQSWPKPVPAAPDFLQPSATPAALDTDPQQASAAPAAAGAPSRPPLLKSKISFGKKRLSSAGGIDAPPQKKRISITLPGMIHFAFLAATSEGIIFTSSCACLWMLAYACVVLVSCPAEDSTGMYEALIEWASGLPGFVRCCTGI